MVNNSMTKDKIKFFKKKIKLTQVNSTNFQSEIWDNDNSIRKKAKQIKKLKVQQFNVK
jgi:hypothetical protein